MNVSWSSNFEKKAQNSVLLHRYRKNNDLNGSTMTIAGYGYLISRPLFSSDTYSSRNNFVDNALSGKIIW